MQNDSLVLFQLAGAEPIPTPEQMEEVAAETVGDKCLAELTEIHSAFDTCNVLLVVLIAAVLAHGFARAILGWCNGG